MTLILIALGLAIIVLALVFGTVALIVLDGSRARTNLFAALTEQHAHDLAEIAALPNASVADAMGALISERRQLLIAVLSMHPDPRAAQRFGIVDTAMTRAEREAVEDEMPTSVADFMERATREGNVANEFRDSAGQPIIPSGMG